MIMRLQLTLYDSIGRFPPVGVQLVKFVELKRRPAVAAFGGVSRPARPDR